MLQSERIKGFLVNGGEERLGKHVILLNTESILSSVIVSEGKCVLFGVGVGGDTIWNHSGGSCSSNDWNLKSEGNVEFLLSEMSYGFWCWN